MKYTEFIYLYPPRPETVLPESYISLFEKKEYIWQPKLNGSCGANFTDGKEVIFMNRHKKNFVYNHMNINELKSLSRGGWTVLVGEYMNKGKCGADRKPFRNKFVIFDILVHENEYLLGTTFAKRQKLLDKLYPSTYYDGWITKISENIFRANNFTTNISQKFKEISKIDMYEGFVGKKPTGILEMGMHEGNNKGWHVKVRKPTKNYT